MEFAAPERTAAESSSGDSASEQHQGLWRRRQTHSNPPLEQEPLRERQVQVHQQQDLAPQQEAMCEQQAQQREHHEQRKLLQPINLLTELEPSVQVLRVAQAQQSQRELPAEHQGQSISREGRQELQSEPDEETGQPSGSPARRLLIRQSAARQMQTVQPRRQPSLQGDCSGTLRQLRAPQELPCGRFQQQQQSEVRQPAELQRQCPQQLGLTEQSVGFAEVTPQEHFHERLRQKDVVEQQQAPLLDTEYDGESLEDVLAAIADAEELDFDRGCHEPSTATDAQTIPGPQESRRPGPERQRQEGQERPSQEQLQQDHQQKHSKERRPQQEQQRHQEQEPQSVNIQCRNLQDKQQRCEVQRSSELDPSAVLREGHALQAGVGRRREPESRENWNLRQQQLSAEARQLTCQQLNEQQPADVQGTRSHQHQRGAPENRGWQQERNVSSAYVGLLPQQNTRQSAAEHREKHDRDAEVREGGRQEVPSLIQQPQQLDPSRVTGIPQAPAVPVTEAEVELEEEVCDFLEADLPPAAVARWSDYLRLREQQQSHQWRQQQQGRDRQLQQRQHQQQHTTATASTQEATASFTTDAPPRTSGVPSAGERSGRDEISSTTVCLNNPSESASNAQRSHLRPAADRRNGGRSSSSSPYSPSRTPSRDLTSPRSAHTAALASTVTRSTSGVQLSSPSAVNDPGSSAEGFVSGSTGGSSSSSGAEYCSTTSNPLSRCRSTNSGPLQCNNTTTTTRSMGQSVPHCYSASDAAGVRVVFTPRSHSRFSSVHGEDVRTPPVNTYRSCRVPAGAASATVSAPPSCTTPLSPGDIRTRNAAHIPAESAPASSPSANSLAAPAARNFTALSPSVPSGIRSARTSCRALRPTAHEQVEQRGVFVSGRAAAASAPRGAPLPSASSSRATAPGGTRVSAAPAASRGDADSSSSMRRPVPLEVFFQLRATRPGGTAPRGSHSFSCNQAAAAPTVPAVDNGTASDGCRLPCPDTVTLASAPEPYNEHGARDSDSIVPGGASITSPSATATPRAASPADGYTAPSSGYGIPVAVADRAEAGPPSIPEGIAPSSGLQGESPTSIGARNSGAALQNVDVGERGNSATRERPQTHVETSSTTAEGQVEADAVSHPAARLPSQKTSENVTRRRDSGAGASECGNTRRLIYLKAHEECIICFVEIRVKGEVAMLEDCRHCFCCACLARWIKKTKTCPLCRRPVTTVELWRQARGSLTKNPLAYAFLRRLRPDKNNVLKPVSVPRRRAGAQQGRSTNRAKAAPSSRGAVDPASTRHASGGEETTLGP